MVNGYIGKIFILFLVGLVSRSVLSRDILVDINNIYSEGLKNDISSFIKNKVMSVGFFNREVKLLCSSLKRQYKVIKKIEFDCVDPDYIKIKIFGVEPGYLINDSFVLANKKRLFKPELFKDFNLGGLIPVRINSFFLRDKLDKDVYFFLQDIPKDVFQKYDLNYIKNTKILLKPKDSNYFVLTDNNFTGSGRFDRLEYILSFRKNNKPMKRRELFDFRYDNCIVARFVDADFWGREQWG